MKFSQGDAVFAYLYGQGTQYRAYYCMGAHCIRRKKSQGVYFATWAPFAPEEELRAEIRRQIDVYAPGGGFILATGCEYPANADFRAAQIMVEEAKTYGRYR